MPDTIKKCKHCNPYDKMYPEKKNGNEDVRNYYNFWLEFVNPNNTIKLNQMFSDQSYKQDFAKNICPFCKNELEDTLLTFNDFTGIGKYSNYNKDFLLVMIELRKKDVIEFETKMQPVRQYMMQRKKEYEAQVDRDLAAIGSTPKCPTCGSTNVHKISGLERGASVMTLGLFSKKINKSYKCGNCKHTW